MHTYSLLRKIKEQCKEDKAVERRYKEIITMLLPGATMIQSQVTSKVN